MIPYTKNVSLKLREIGFVVINTKTIDNPKNYYIIEKLSFGLFYISINHERKKISIFFLYGYDRVIPLLKINSISQLKKIMEIFNS
jgi:protein-tyrosine phosphatase